jgi:hypothetical protein
VRFRMECVREGVSLGEAGERSGEGGCWGRPFGGEGGRREEGGRSIRFWMEWIEEVAPAPGFEWQISTVKTAS